MNSRQLMCSALRGEATPRPPIWLMRQAGRYMADYRHLRLQHGFMELCHQPDLATEITLQPIKAFGMDAAIFFCDILVTAEALGSDLDIVEKVGPVISNPIRSMEQVHSMVDHASALGALNYTSVALKQIRAALPADKALLGFAGAPLTVASYMIEGGSSSQVHTVFRMIQEAPEMFHAIMDRLTDLTIDYIALQREAGVDGVQLFESWASLLPKPIYLKHVFPHVQKIVEASASPDKPLIMFALAEKDLWHHLGQLPAQALSIGANHNLKDFRHHFPKLALQGNLDSRYLLGDQKILLNAAGEVLETMRGEPGYIFNTGHGITPKTPEDNVRALVEKVQSWS